MEKDKLARTLVEKLIEKEGDWFRKNLFKLLDLLEVEARWLQDEETQNEENKMKRYSTVLKTLRVTTTEKLQSLMLLFYVKGKTDLQKGE